MCYIEALCQSPREIERAIGVKGPEIIDADVCGSTIKRVPQQQFRAIRIDCACHPARVVGVEFLTG